MKPIQFSLSFALALVPAVLLAAENPPIFNTGDLLLGIRATSGDGVADNYVVNIGPAATYRDATAPVVASVGNIAADLTAIYGPTWHDRTDILWGIAGSPSNAIDIGIDPYRTLYISRPQASPSTPADPWPGLNGGQRGEVSTKIQTMTSTSFGFRKYEKSENSDYAVIEGTTDVASWASFMAGGSQTTLPLDFNAFGGIEGQPTQTLSFFRMATSTPSLEGSFTISSAGVITFTPAAAAGISYATWAATNVAGEAHNLDHDGDGVQNGIEFFMGVNGSGFTANPQIGAGSTITWPRATDRTVSSVIVQYSTDLQQWNPAPGAVYNAGSVTYTVPAGQSKYFVRLLVTP